MSPDPAVTGPNPRCEVKGCLGCPLLGPSNDLDAPLDCTCRHPAMEGRDRKVDYWRFIWGTRTPSPSWCPLLTAPLLLWRSRLFEKDGAP